MLILFQSPSNMSVTSSLQYQRPIFFSYMLASWNTIPISFAVSVHGDSLAFKLSAIKP